VGGVIKGERGGGEVRGSENNKPKNDKNIN